MVNFTFEGKQYSLGFNRKTAAALENAGFNVNEIDNKGNIMIPLIVQASFMMNHKKMRSDEIDKIYEQIGNKDGFIVALVKEYRKTYESLIGSGDEDDENFIKWAET